MGCFPPVQTAQAAEPCKAGSIGPGLKGPGRPLRASTGLPGDLLYPETSEAILTAPGCRSKGVPRPEREHQTVKGETPYGSFDVNY